MSSDQFSEERLNAFIDGELDSLEKTDVFEALHNDDSLRQQACELRQLSELFRHAYGELPGWHEEVFFYLCMEDARLWMPVFGFDYQSNEQFEMAMEASYLNKIRQRRLSPPTH